MISINKRKPVPAYRRSSLSPGRRVKDLLSRMTREEKAAQKLVDARGNFEQSCL